jgi:hypothetical protein
VHEPVEGDVVSQREIAIELTRNLLRIPRARDLEVFQRAQRRDALDGFAWVAAFNSQPRDRIAFHRELEHGLWTAKRDGQEQSEEVAGRRPVRAPPLGRSQHKGV